MDSLESLVENVVKFHNKTLQFASLGGPFSLQQLETMFAEAHFCADLVNLPPVYSPVVDQLQEKFTLLQAPHKLLVCLCDNLRVNRESLDRARQLFDRHGTDLDTWLLVQQRHQMRDQFLATSQTLKQSDSEGWRKLK